MNRLISFLCVLLLVGCQAQPRPPQPGTVASAAAESVPTWPDQARRFVIDRAASELRIVVYPDGPLARLGHAHVIGGPVIEGELALAEPWQGSALRLSIDVDGLIVDRPDWRRDEGFERDPSDAAIAGTAENLRSPAVLDAAAHPRIEVQSLGLRGPRWQPDIDLRVTLRGQVRDLSVPIALTIADERLVATGQFSLNQSDFGLQPFSVAGGQLAVADGILIRFRIVALAGP